MKYNKFRDLLILQARECLYKLIKKETMREKYGLHFCVSYYHLHLHTCIGTLLPIPILTLFLASPNKIHCVRSIRGNFQATLTGSFYFTDVSN